MAEVAKKKPAQSADTSDKAATPPLENMPERPKTIPHKKTERLFCAWTGDLHVDPSDPDDNVVIIRGIRIFGVKAECTEFAVDQEPAWKWVETGKDRDVVEDIIAKANR